MLRWQENPKIIH